MLDGSYDAGFTMNLALKDPGRNIHRHRKPRRQPRRS